MQAACCACELALLTAVKGSHGLSVFVSPFPQHSYGSFDAYRGFKLLTFQYGITSMLQMFSVCFVVRLKR